MGQWSGTYLLSETEYWTPEALEQLTEKLQSSGTAGTVADGGAKGNYSDSGQQKHFGGITEMVKQGDRC